MVSGLAAEAIGRTALDVDAVILGMRAENDNLETVFQNLIRPQEALS